MENSLKVSDGKDVHILTKNDKIQITDTTIIKYPNERGDPKQNWVRKCNDKYSNGKIQNFVKSTKTNSPTENGGATTSPPIGDSFMYIEAVFQNSDSNNVFYAFDRNDFINKTNITSYYSRFSI